MTYFQPFFRLDDEALLKMLGIKSKNTDYAKSAAKKKLVQDGVKITVFAGYEGVTCEDLLSKLESKKVVSGYESSSDYQL